MRKTMKLATLKDGSRDGQLIVVSRDLKTACIANGIAPTLQRALDDWNFIAPQLEELYVRLNAGRAANSFEFVSQNCLAPLPRAYQWADGSSYVNHVELVRKARQADMPESFWHDPLMYQGGSDDFIGPCDDIVLASEKWGIDFESEIAIITGDVPMGVNVQYAGEHIRLLMLVNDVSLRNLIPAELAKGFGFFQSKPATSFSPVAVTPDELGEFWRDGKVHLPLRSSWNGNLVGQPNAGVDMVFSFPQLITHLCKTRNARAGTIIGSVTVSKLRCWIKMANQFLARLIKASLRLRESRHLTIRLFAITVIEEKLMHAIRSLLVGLTAVLCVPAPAQVKVGVDLSMTGAAASIGASSKKAVLLWPKEIAGQHVEYIILDDASDPSNAVRNARKLITEDKVDIVIGPNLTSSALAMLDVMAESSTPMVTLAASAVIVMPMDEKRKWVFKMPQNDTHMATILTQNMADRGFKRVGFIGFADAYGDGWWSEFSKLAEIRKITIVATERYARTDASVTGQVLKLIAAQPDAILIAGSGTPAILPQKTLFERGYKGQIYQTHGIASPEFLKLGGKEVEGTLFPTGPAVVASQLPTNNAVKKTASEFIDRYQAAYPSERGMNGVTQFAADAWGAYLLTAHGITEAVKVARPGTKAFRLALRASLETTHDLAVPQGVINMTPTDHVGLDQRSRVMAKIQGGKFVYASGG